MHDSSLVQEEDNVSSEFLDGIQEEKLDDVFKDYIALLAESYPFSLDLKIDERYVVQQLAELWPEAAEWAAQAYDLWERINAIVHSIPGITGTPEAILRLSAAMTPLTPKDLPDPKEIAAVATFDSASGVVKSCILLPTKYAAEDLESLAIPSGLMLVCQPLVRALGPQVDTDTDKETETTDMRDSGLGSGENIYADRNKDVSNKDVNLPPQKNAAQNSTQDNAEKEVVHVPLHEPIPPPQPS